MDYQKQWDQSGTQFCEVYWASDGVNLWSDGVLLENKIDIIEDLLL